MNWKKGFERLTTAVWFVGVIVFAMEFFDNKNFGEEELCLYSAAWTGVTWGTFLGLDWILAGFTGRRSKRTFTTPVRYIREGEIIRAFTAATNQWWRNMRGGAEVRLLIEGNESRYRAEAIHSAPDRVRAGLRALLRDFPQDAPYYEIAMQADKQPNAQDLESASQNTVMIEAHRISGKES